MYLNLVECICLHCKVLLVTVFVCCFARFCTYTGLEIQVHLNFGKCVPMQNGRESVYCRASPKSYDTIPPAMSYRQMKRILPLYAKIQLSWRQILISFLKMRPAYVHMNVILLWAVFFFSEGVGGGGGREQTPCIDWCNPNEYGFKAFLVLKMVVDLKVRSENGN